MKISCQESQFGHCFGAKFLDVLAIDFLRIKGGSITAYTVATTCTGTFYKRKIKSLLFLGYEYTKGS